MQRPLFFLDLDGVVADFTGHAARLLHRDLSECPADYGLSRVFGLPFNVIDERIQAEADFWATIPKLPWADELVAQLKEYTDLYVLSSPWPGHVNCQRDKVVWCAEQFGIACNRVILTPHKWLLAAPDRWLLDDLTSTCERWHDQGGNAIIFPARHNFWLNLSPDQFVSYVTSNLHEKTYASVHG